MSAPVPSLARPLLSLLTAAVCAVAVWLLARAAVGTASGQRLDQLILSGAEAHQGRLSTYAELAVGSVSTPVIAGILALTVMLVLLRRRPTTLFPLGVLVLGANLTTQVIKHVLVTREALGPGIEITPNSFPSGHTTLAATAMVALVLATGRARVVLAPLGVLWTLAAGVGTLVVGWHRPSDVVGAIGVAAAWTCLVLALDGLHTRHRARREAATGRRRSLARRAPGSPRTAADLVVALLLGVAGVAGLAYGAMQLAGLGLPLDLADTAQQLEAFRATAAVIGGSTAAWMALVLGLRTPGVPETAMPERVP